jgi:S1-C subfamily serine protease
LAGLAADVGGGLALVPGDVIKSAADRLRGDPDRKYGRLGIEVQPLTAGVGSAARAHVGVVVTWVDANGPAAGQLVATDVIEAVDENWIFTYEHWRARVPRLAVGQTTTLRVRRRNEIRNVALTATPPAASGALRPLGLTMRAAPRIGVEISSVAPGSAAALAGLQPGDVITIAGDRQAPTPAMVRREFAAAADRPMIVGVTRGNAHHVLALEKR